MKVTIENVKEIEEGWFKRRPIYKLYVGLTITNEERFVLENKVHLQAFKLIEGVADPNNAREPPQNPPSAPANFWTPTSRGLDTRRSYSLVRFLSSRD